MGIEGMNICDELSEQAVDLIREHLKGGIRFHLSLACQPSREAGKLMIYISPFSVAADTITVDMTTYQVEYGPVEVREVGPYRFFIDFGFDLDTIKMDADTSSRIVALLGEFGLCRSLIED